MSTHRSAVLGDVAALVAAESLLQADLVVVLVLDPVLLVLRLVRAAGVGAAVEGATGGVAVGRRRAHSLVQFHFYKILCLLYPFCFCTIRNVIVVHFLWISGPKSQSEAAEPKRATEAVDSYQPLEVKVCDVNMEFEYHFW